jgi:hypothetical protein
MQSLVQRLFDGPIDLVGDIHGEIAALTILLQHLGYDEDGLHPEKRRLVFLGDLMDRGPDSPAVSDYDKRESPCVLSKVASDSTKLSERSDLCSREEGPGRD